ncbi:MAG: DnaJ domain-containing protein [Bryobacterales bacterium]|nr:DnaJ domain-containing protein [Bryobacterales bacterium]
MFTMGTQTEGIGASNRTRTDGVTERRRNSRATRDRFAQAKVNYQRRPGFSEMMPVRLTDLSDVGCGILTSVRLEPGTVVSVAGPFGPEGQQREMRHRARVAWTVPNPGGGFRCGLAFERDFNPGGEHGVPASEAELADDAADLYEVLQISANAEMDTIHRVFRLLAQRFHPDNAESGDPEAFRKAYEAYKVLSDPEQRAAYDARLQRLQTKRWKIFERPQAASGVEAERRKRQGVLALLYVKRMQTPGSPGLSLPELEDLLGVPREHLEFSLWYLRENSLITRTDNGRTVITAKGVDEAERLEAAPDGPKLFLLSPADSPSA